MGIVAWFKEVTTATSVMQAVTMVILIGQMGGVVPFTYDLYDGRVVAKFHMYFVLLPLYFVSVYLFSIYSVSKDYDWNMPSSMMEVVWKFGEFTRYYIAYMWLLICAVTSFANVRCYAGIFNDLQKVDVLLRKLGINLDYTRLRRKYLNQSLFHLFVYLVLIAFYSHFLNHVDDRFHGFFAIVTSCTPGTVISINLVLFKFILDMIVNYINELNGMLDKFVKPKVLNTVRVTLLETKLLRATHRCNSDSTVKTKIDEVTTIWKIYDLICDSCQHTSEAFSSRLVVCFFGSFLSLLVNMYFSIIKSYEIQQGQRSYKNYILLMFSLEQSVFYLVLFMIPLNACHTVIKLTKTTVALINRMMIHEQQDEIASILHLISCHMLQRFPKFSLGGMCVIDNTLSFTVIGGFSTYMVILLQFSILKLNTSSKESSNSSTALILE